MTVNEIINQSVFLFGADSLLNDSTGPMDSSRRVRGGPAWVKSDRYTIDAESGDPAATGPTEGLSVTPTGRLFMGPMLRLLLKDRFQLKTHHETEEVPMYSLTIAKGGLKMKLMEEGGCAPFDPTKNRPRDTPPGDKPWCLQGIGFADPRAMQSDWTINGAGQPLSNLAGALSIVMGRHVFEGAVGA
jgi:uncharacterized protein (TIGR03435 family)